MNIGISNKLLGFNRVKKYNGDILGKDYKTVYNATFEGGKKELLASINKNEDEVVIVYDIENTKSAWIFKYYAFEK